MAYRLDPGAALTDSVRQVAREQIAGAVESLAGGGDLEEAVHDARKRCKKLRALLRLVRPGLGRTYASENAAFRDIARRFSEIRDAQVLSETVGKLATHAEGEGACEVLAPVRDWAGRRREAVLAGKNARRGMAAACKALEKAAKRAGRWRIDGAPVDALQGGLKKTYRRARDGWREATAAPGPELLHEWRKRVKYHWYHCRLLREAWPEAMQLRIAALDRLGDALGDDHDLVVLIGTLRSDAPDLAPAILRAAETIAAERSQILRAAALGQAPRLFVERPKALSRRLSGQWTLAAAAA